MRKCTITREDDGIWVATIPNIPGFVSKGQTREEAIEKLKEQLKEYMEEFREEAWP